MSEPGFARLIGLHAGVFGVFAPLLSCTASRGRQKAGEDVPQQGAQVIHLPPPPHSLWILILFDLQTPGRT